MNNQKNEQAINRENRKKGVWALLLFLLCALAGVAIGVLSVHTAPDWQIQAGKIMDSILTALAWAGNPALLLFCMIPGSILLAKSRRALKVWDGESEADANKIDKGLSCAMVLSNIGMILSYFFFAVAFYQLQDSSMLLQVGVFVACMAYAVLLQQHAVDLTRQMNPEKQGSVYDRKFHKKWMDSCDEAEKLQIFQAGNAAFQAGNLTCCLLWLLLLLLNIFVPVSLLAIAMVSLIWLVMTIAYFIAAMRLDHPKR